MLQYYTDFYAEPAPADANKVADFLAPIPLSTIVPEETAALELPVTLEEVRSAIKGLASGKTPGPDGLDGAFYRHFSALLGPLLVLLFNECIEKGQFPESMRSSVITLLLKADKDPLDVTSYRPLALLNHDQKIFAKILANRLQPLLTKLVHADQSGFIPGRSTRDSLRRAFILLEGCKAGPDAAFLSLDIAKAFDSLSWEFLFGTLHRMGFGSRLCRMVRLLYTSPRSVLAINGTLSAAFPIMRGTRQGCPLSPLLFALAMEPMAVLLRASFPEAGLPYGGVSHLLSLYADDLLLFLKDPPTSLEGVLGCVDRFSALSGLRTHPGKSLLFPLCAGDGLGDSFMGIRVVRAKFKYLGVWMCRGPKALLDENYYSLLPLFGNKIQCWSKLQLSLAGRAALLKMTLVPKLLYIFTNVPCAVPEQFFRQCTSLFSKFLWGNRQPRIAFATVTRSLAFGGFEVPNLRWYYFAAQIAFVVQLLDDSSSKVYTQMARSLIRKCRPAALPGIPELIPALPASPIKVSLQVWARLLRRLGDCSPFLATIPLRDSPIAHKVGMGVNWDEWETAGLGNLGDLIDGESYRTKRSILEMLGRSPARVFQVLQLMASIRSRWGQTPAALSDSSALGMLWELRPYGHLVSHLYARIRDLDSGTPLAARAGWEGDLQEDLSDDDWTRACQHTSQVGISQRYRLIQYKFLVRSYMTPVRIHRFAPDSSPCCRMCDAPLATFLHLIWDCPEISKFWRSVLHELSEIIGYNVPAELRLVYLGSLSSIRKEDRRFISLSLLLAKRELALLWMRPRPPRLDGWMRSMASCHEKESRFDLVFPLASKPRDIWEKFVYYLMRRAGTSSTGCSSPSDSGLQGADGGPS